ncbi:hypothetical protein [Pannonibacter phragmitetus]|uniref:hypothetical protein n=1 Tax=Pannonibacter phragmitetus TaxID=121719 RepID=UPI000B978024|nr:hypothetical protein [Pannonibacter phragmitetus]
MYSEGTARWPYRLLGLDEPSDDPKLLKRAYARQLKQVDQAAEAEAFQALRQAYEAALRWAHAEAAPVVPAQPLPELAPPALSPAGNADDPLVEAQRAAPEAAADDEPLAVPAAMEGNGLPPDPAAEQATAPEPAELAHHEALERRLQAIYGLRPSFGSASRLIALLVAVEDLSLGEQRAVGFAVMAYLRKCMRRRRDGGHVLGRGFNKKLRLRLEDLFHWWTDNTELVHFAGHDQALASALLACRPRKFRPLQALFFAFRLVAALLAAGFYLALLIAAVFAMLRPDLLGLTQSPSSLVFSLLPIAILFAALIGKNLKK